MSIGKRALVLAFTFLSPGWLGAQRVSGKIQSRGKLAPVGGTHAKAQPRYDQGPVELSLPMYLTLRFAPSAEQQADLEQLLQDQQDPNSPRYHQWLTPEEYSDRFGLSQSDLASIQAWLEAEGFTVTSVARGRRFIAFTGTAAQAAHTFHTEIHRYLVDGERHIANTTIPAVPAMVAPVIADVWGLHDFHPRHTGSGAIPRYGYGGRNYLAPADIATIYDLQPLYNLGIDGTGQSIAVVGETSIVQGDIQSFRALFGLPNKPPVIKLVPPDPGMITGSVGEADLDLEWASAVARNATIIYVYSVNSFDAASYAIDQNLAPIISMSFGACENNYAAAAHSLQSMAQQANAQGITWVSSSGDAGGAGCDSWFTPTHATATQGLAVDFPASIPEVTGVGGTEFNEGSGNYWSASGSALSYIPEMVWNDSSSTLGLAASGGGASVLYKKPAWQTGPGVPNDGARDVPDIALSSSQNHDGYITCDSSALGGNCANGIANGSFLISGGTSAAAPTFAGMLALIEQYLVANGLAAKPGLGNINPVLYRVAQSAPAAVHDVAIGGNRVPCQTGTPDCNNGSLGYAAGPNYDQATGLGSVDGYNLAISWKQAGCTYSINPTSASVPAGGGSGSVSITTQSGCPWSVSNNTPAMITVGTAASGTGNGSVGYSVGANKTSAQITGSLTMAGLTFTITQTAASPDLTITSLTAPTVITPGGQVNVSATAANQGGAAAGAFKVEFYFSATASITAAAVDTGTSCSFPALAAGTSQSCSVVITVPASLSPGTWYVGAIADPGNQVVESNKANNSRVADTGPATVAAAAAKGATVTVWRPSSGMWYTATIGGTATVSQWGLPGDIPAAGDYDHNGILDNAIWRPANGTWYINLSSSGANLAVQWGLPGDVPVPGDYDGDGKTDYAVWRPSNGTWYILLSSTGATVITQWGLPTDVPAPADFDGDGRTDLAVWRPLEGNWYIRLSASGTSVVKQWGLAGDIPVPGDYDGDGKADLAVWRPATGTWYVNPSSNPTGPIARQWGLAGDIVVPRDYDGDGKTDYAVWRPATGMWYIVESGNIANPMAVQWGLSGDDPAFAPAAVLASVHKNGSNSAPPAEQSDQSITGQAQPEIDNESPVDAERRVPGALRHMRLE